MKARTTQALAVFGILLVGLSATGVVTLRVWEIERQRNLALLSGIAEQGIGSINSRVTSLRTLINSTHAILQDTPDLDRTRLNRYVRGLAQSQQLTGARALYWAPRVSGGEWPDVREHLEAAGVGRTLHPPDSDLEWHCPLFALTGENPELNACEEPALIDALTRAMETGNLEAASLLHGELPDLSPDPGYLIVRWLESGPVGLPGWVGLAVDAGVLFAPVSIQTGPLALSIYDISRGPESSVELTATREPLNLDEIAQSTLVRTFDIDPGRFALRVEDPDLGTRIAWFTAVTGILATTLIVLLIGITLRTRSQAIEQTKSIRSAAAQTERMLESITNNIFEGIYRGEFGRGLIYVNQSLARMFGFERAEDMIAHAGPVLYANPAQRAELGRMLEEHGHYRNIEIEYIRPDGSRFIAVNNAVATRDEHGEVRYFDGAIYDITERKHAEERANRLANYDSLTDLPNRSLLDQRLRRCIENARRTRTSLALMFLDLDNFKTINDSLGHEAGDELLRKAATRFRKTLRNDDLIARQGGDEFLIVLDQADSEAASISARRIIEAFSEAFRIQNHELRVTTSIGIAMFPEDGKSSDQLIRNADAAMYAAKDEGRSTFRFYTDELNELAHQRLAIQNDLQRALERDELHLALQPIVALDSGRIVGAEALLRWQHPERGPVSPADFIPVAEQSGQIGPIGNWVIRQACRQLADWKEARLPEIRLAINVSAVQFRPGRLLEQVRDSLGQYPIDPRLLEIELTESLVMHDSNSAAEIISSLREIGVHVAIDDFGTGYSSLSQLKRFQISKLKIDQSFIRDITFDADDAAIVAAVLDIARNLNLDVTAEGVETREQAEYLKALNCPNVQGYFFARPMPAEEFTEMLARGKILAR